MGDDTVLLFLSCALIHLGWNTFIMIALIHLQPWTDIQATGKYRNAYKVDTGTKEYHL